MAPDGTSVVLFSNVGNVGNGENFTNTIFDDAATTPIANGGPPFFGPFKPQLPLCAVQRTTSSARRPGSW